MKIGKYRVSAGHYAVGEFTIYGCYPRWQLRDEHDDIVDDFATLRDALTCAIIRDRLRQQLLLAKNVAPTKLPIHPSELARMLYN